MPCFAQAGHGFQPAEDLLDPFALELADRVARMAGGAAVDGALAVGGVLGHVRRDVQAARGVHEIPRVIVLVAAQRDAALGRNFLHQLQGALALRGAGGLGEPRADHQPVAVLHQHVAQVAKLGRRGIGLLVQPRLGIGGGLVGLVGALLLAEVGLRILALARRARLCA